MFVTRGVAKEPGTPSTIRTINRKLVLELIRKNGPISRAEITRRLGTSAPTVSSAVSHLMRVGLVVPLRTGPSTGGRRPVLLGFNEQSYYVLALGISTHLRAGVFTLAGRKVAETRDLLKPSKGNEVVDRSISLIERVVVESGVPRHLVRAIGVSAPGIVDPVSGTVSHAPLLGSGNWPLGQILVRRFQVPALVENDVNAAALGERLLGVGQHFDHFVYIFIGEGIGAGIMLDGNLYRGANNAAGEIGYMVVDPDWTADDLGGFGCLESMASSSALRHLVSEPLAIPGSETGCENLTLDQLLEAGKQSESVRGVANSVIKLLAAGIANVCVTLNPSAVILGGPNVSAPVKVELEQRLARLIPCVSPLHLSTLGDDATVIGAASLAIDYVLACAVDDNFSVESSFQI